MIRIINRRLTARTAALLFLGAVILLPGCSAGEKGPATCAICGMDAAISKGRFLLHFEDGATADACSGHCAAQMAVREGSPLYKVRVYGYDVEKLIDGTSAVYVMGADRIPEKSMAPAVFAFSKQQAAEAFLEEHGGRTATLEDVLAMALPPGGSGR
jgi:hypothetical protein